MKSRLAKLALVPFTILVVMLVSFTFVYLSMSQHERYVFLPSMWPAFVFMPIIATVMLAVGPSFTYPKVGDDKLRLYTFGIPIRSVRFNDIERVEMISGWPFFVYFHRKILFTARWGISLSDKVILVKRRSGWLWAVILSPRNPDEFFRELNDAIEAERGPQLQ
jgi:hypothetical protein